MEENLVKLKQIARVKLETLRNLGTKTLTHTIECLGAKKQLKLFYATSEDFMNDIISIEIFD